MRQISNDIVYRQAMLLFRRTFKQSLIQLLPSSIFTFLFAKLYLIYQTTDVLPIYLYIYFFLAFILEMIISNVIYFREANLEISNFSYLSIMGYQRLSIGKIIMVKWLIKLLVGFAIGVFLFAITNFRHLYHAGFETRLAILTFALVFNFLLVTGILASIFKFFLKR